MDVFVEQRREELYGVGRNKDLDEMLLKLKASHILQDGEFNIRKQVENPGFIWSSVTHDDYKNILKTEDQGKQYDESYKQVIGSDIPLKHEGIPEYTYTSTTVRDDFIDKGTNGKRSYIGNNSTTNWVDMTPRITHGASLGQSEYKEVFVTEGLEYSKPSYGKIDTSKSKLPLPYVEQKHRIDVNLGSDPMPVGLSSETGSQFSQTITKPFNDEAIQEMKREMEHKSRIFRSGDYNTTEDGLKQSVTDVDFGKRAKGSSYLSTYPNNKPLDEIIDEKLHYMPQLIEKSMKENTTRTEGADGKVYHTKAHFNLGLQPDNKMSTYFKDFLQHSGQQKPDKIKPTDAGVFGNREGFNGITTNSVDYASKGNTTGISADHAAIRRANMDKFNQKNINFADDSIGSALTSVFTRDFRQPPENYKRISAAKEKRCDFDFLVTNDTLPNYTKRLLDNTENKDNFRGAPGVSNEFLSQDKARIKSAARRRAVSGRRAHFKLGDNKISYNTANKEAYTGKPIDSDNIPAAGKVDRKEKDFPHFSISENTQDRIIDPYMPSLQESKNALSYYADRQKSSYAPNSSTMQTDYTPISDRRYTFPQQRQMKCEEVKSSKPSALSHYFHTDTSNRSNYETTMRASFVKPELMSGKVHLSSLQ